MTDTQELLPCPFCGGKHMNITYDKNEYGEIWEIICQNCSVTIPCCDSQEEAIGRWNHRAVSRQSAAGDVVVRRYQSIADIPKQVLAAIESDCEIVDKVANALKASVCHLGMLEDAYILANIALDIIKQAAIAAMHPVTQPNVEELVRRIQLRIENNEDENEALHGLKGAFESGRSEGLDDAITIIRTWANNGEL